MYRPHKAFCRMVGQYTFEADNEAAIKLLKKVKIGDTFPFSMDDDPTPPEHRALMGFMGFVFDNQEQIKTFNLFKLDIKKQIKWGEFQMMEVGNETYAAFIPGSWKWKDINHKKFNTQIMPAVIEYIQSRYGISFEDWKENRYDYDICETPECFNPQQHVHHIFPGHGNRDKCDDLGLTVKICENCHRRFHLETGDGSFKQKHIDHYCRIRGYENAESALLAVNTYSKRQK